VDTYSLVDAFVMQTLWNYPGAYFKGELIIYNITFMTSSERTFAENPRLISSNMIGNSTIELLDSSDTYSDTNDEVPATLVYVNPFCFASEPVVRNVTMSKFDISLRNPNKLLNRFTAVGGGGVDINTISYITLSEFYFHDFTHAYYTTVMIQSVFSDVVNYVNSVHENWVIDTYFFSLFICGTVRMENLTFTNSAGMSHPYLYSEGNLEVTYKDLYFKNVTIPSTSINPIIHNKDLPTTNVVFDGVYVENWNILNSLFFKNTAEFYSISMNNFYFKNTTIGSGNGILTLENIKKLEILNHTYDRLDISESIDGWNALIHIVTFNFDSNYDEILIKVSGTFFIFH
jgi:hypothetical protein